MDFPAPATMRQIRMGLTYSKTNEGLVSFILAPLLESVKLQNPISSICDPISTELLVQFPKITFPQPLNHLSSFVILIIVQKLGGHRNGQVPHRILISLSCGINFLLGICKIITF